MASKAIILLVAAILVLLLSAGDVNAEDRWTEEQVLTFYLPAPAKIIAGPGAGSTNESDSAFGSLSVFDVPARDGLDNTSQTLGQCRGVFLVDSYDGNTTLFLFTVDFTSHAPIGSVVVSGDYHVLWPKSVLPIIGGSGEFLGAEGYVLQQLIVPEGPFTIAQILDAPTSFEMHYKLQRG